MPVTYNDHTADTSPNDGDKFPFWDVVASATRSITWENIKSVLLSHIGVRSQPNHNFIPNGDFDIWQRGTSFVALTSNVVADRFRYANTSAAVHTVTRDTDIPTFAQSNFRSQYSLKVDCTTADASVAAGDIVVIYTTLEGYDYNQLREHQITLSFWVKATKTGTYCISFRNGGADRSYVVEYTINASNTWEKKTVTLTINPSGGTEGTTNGVGMRITWAIMAGSTFQGSANSWVTGNFLATSNQVNGADSTNNNFWLSQVKLEKGANATTFTKPSFHDILLYCMRYYFKTFEYGTTPAQNAGLVGAMRFTAGKAGANPSFSTMRYPVPMRDVPTVTFFNPSAANGQVRDSSIAADCSSTIVAGNASATNFSINTTGNASTAVGDALDVHFTADAEMS